ncbi:TMEM165/GDT1 family protein [Tistrella bauzanensis]
MMEALGISTLVVALAEIGDKTQLLALALTLRYRAPWPVAAGILVATLANHAVAGAVGAAVAAHVDPDWMRWILGLSFIAMGLWVLVPDKLDDDDTPKATARGAFLATTLTFFVVEIGDKTQIATVALAADYTPLIMVIVGTTLGMMIANLPVVFLGERIARAIPLGPVRKAAAALLIVLGGLALVGDAASFGLNGPG